MLQLQNDRSFRLKKTMVMQRRPTVNLSLEGGDASFCKGKKKLTFLSVFSSIFLFPKSLPSCSIRNDICMMHPYRAVFPVPSLSFWINEDEILGSPG